jgi:primosomal protein N' (replication factor Y)
MSPAADARILRVAVAAPLPGLFDYLAPPDMPRQRLHRGVRLQVPFGPSTRIGFLWQTASSSQLPHTRLKPVLALLDEEPLLPPPDLALLRWAADYYQHPLGEVLLQALPAALRGTGAGPLPRAQAWRLTGAGRQARPARPARRQEALLALLGTHPAGLPLDTLVAACGPCGAVLKRLQEKGWAEPCPLPPTEPSAPHGPLLNPEQAAAVAAVTAALGRFQPFLLDGVTGSGKTEVYLHLVERVLERGGQVLVLVPEIGLTPQLQRRLARRIAAPVALLHSGLAEGERAVAWQRARNGEAAVVLGTRSAVFVPLPRLALILVDEEHDLSFKQQDGFRYHARDLAVRRAQQRACPVLLGSATPSLETLRNARDGRYTRLRLGARAGAARPPRMDLIDLRSVRLQAGLSPALVRLVRETLEAGQQALLFLNRRGFAPQLTCHDCGWVAGCPSCDARLTLHLAAGLLWCHHCGFRHRALSACPKCGRTDLRPLGQGTERLEETLGRLFPGVPVARVDRDSTRRRGRLEQLLAEARDGRYPLLLGTQMLAKGHHLPQVTLVGMLDLDQGLYGADFRAAERMAQLLIQVAGRAGRADKPGRVAIQTRHPDHPLLQTLIHRGYGAFADLALAERAAAHLPPFYAQALVRAEAKQPEPPRAFLERAGALARERDADLQLWGPVPAPMERRAGQYRAHLLLQADERTRLQALLAVWIPRLHQLKEGGRVRWSIDVDPQETV